ncbi:fumarylacetoacetate hydrolase family protein [Pelobacter seleniigenes]|uniref:fumarylacetoacetate hydrolase family protein n=1 Tax=Pelobacter seleniigenes TaxID=407188 RepID=UPI0004A77C2F|nr:fumarylacetoacetate hydrolase family protein [Pelobacter seleniigenes]
MYQVQPEGSTDTYTLGKVVCIGRNYFDHIKELDNEIPEQPVLFIKPATSIIGEGGRIEIPPGSADCHHELELAVLIGKTAKKIAEQDAMSCVAGYGIGIDLTLRDIQSNQKKKGLPWEIAKGFDTSCPLSHFVAASRIDDPHDLQMTLTVNGEVRQDGSSALMMRKIPQIISAASEYFTLLPGDIVLTGTPAGVSQIKSGDVINAKIDQIGELNVSVL